MGCIACSAGVMLPLFAVGMASPVWMVLGSALILLYKVAGPWARWSEMALSSVMVLIGAWLIAGG